MVSLSSRRRHGIFATAAAVALAATAPACATDDTLDDMLDVAGDTATDDPPPDALEAYVGGTAAYRVTVRNLTATQALTPPVIATHSRHVALFRAGFAAPNGVRQIAENGNLDPLVAALEASDQIGDFAVAVAGNPPPLLPGQEVTVEVDASAFANRLSLAAMLICSNDGFTGLDSVYLPRRVGRSYSYYARGYDAGTEINTEDFADIVPPCQALSGVSSDDTGTGTSNPDLLEGSVVLPHPGIDGTLATSDLTVADHGWSGPIAQVTVTRIARYDVTIENLTTGQPFTPPVVATHRAGLRLFRSGNPASNGIVQIAENGNVGPLVDSLSASKNVSDVVVAAGNPPPVLPGSAVNFSITSTRRSGDISFASMLICTNDGFTGVTGLRLPRFVGESKTRDGVGYDAGSEINTEDFADIVPPCQGLIGVSSDDAGTGASNPDLAEGSVVSIHPGVDGSLETSDLTVAAHGWDTTAPTTRITVTRAR